MSVSVEALQTPEPHYIPGYSGHCPGYIFRAGDSFASLSHKILLDPVRHRTGQLILSQRTTTDFQVIRRTEGGENSYQVGNIPGNSVYKQPMVPGYTGSIPGSSGGPGKRFALEALEGLTEFQRDCIRRQQASNHLLREIQADSGQAIPTLEEREKSRKSYSLPLQEVRPEVRAILRTISLPEPPPAPADWLSPYFKQVQDKEAAFIPGYTGAVPFGMSQYGQCYGEDSRAALTDFTASYRLNQSTEWAPVNLLTPQPPLLVSSNEIYHKHLGMLPSYTGHIPGGIFRSGKTYGADSRDAKRWLRGDRTG